MALDPRISLAVKPTQGTPLVGAFLRGREQGQEQKAAREQQAAKTEREVAIEEQQAELKEGQIEAQDLENLSTREQQRLKSSIIGAAQLDGFLQSGNINVARDFLNRRRQELGQRIAAGESVNTIETDEALQLLDTDLEQLKSITSSSLELGKQSGILKRPGGDKGLPADVVFADELGKARDAGDNQRIQDLLLAKKALDKGQTVDDQGNIIAAPGAATAATELSEAKEAGKQQAKLKLEPSVVQAKEIAKKVGTAEGVNIVELNERIAGLPRLEEIVNELSDLGKVATFTTAGKARDATRRQLGLDVGVGAIARKEYISKVDNEILPLLRQTFGAAFTEREGTSLKATLGDPDASPQEKDAVLKSFIATKQSQIETLKRQVPQDGISILPNEPAEAATGGLSADEAAELQELEQRFGR